MRRRGGTSPDRRGIVTTYVYDDADRLTSKTYSDSTPDLTFDYDDADRLTEASSSVDALTRTYDLAGRMLTEGSTRSSNFDTTYTYDAADNRLTLAIDGTGYLSYGYESGLRLETITRGGNVFEFEYDDANRRAELSHPNGLTTAYTYDDLGRLLTIGSSVNSWTYTYDNAGNRSSKSGNSIAETYGHDPLHRLTRAARTGSPASSWAYDAVGNRVSEQSGTNLREGSFNDRNELEDLVAGGPMVVEGTLNEPANVEVRVGSTPYPTQIVSGGFQATVPATTGLNTFVVAATDGSGNTRTDTFEVVVADNGATLTYDDAGNLATRTEGGVTWAYTWNAENQLVSVSADSGGGPATVATFAYDPLGRRVEKVAGGVTTSWAYDGQDILKETISSGAGAGTFRYVHGPGIDEPLARENTSGGALTYFHADGLGSITKHTNQAGAVVLTRQYDAWGNLEAGASTPGYAFTGREWDPEIGLYYYRARYYDPKIGGFLSEDPIRFDGGNNFYTYVLNNPIRNVDPYGKKGLEYFIRVARGLYDRVWERVATRKVAANALDKGQDVLVKGPGHGGDAWKLGKEKFGRDAVRSGPDAKAGGYPHVQHRRGGRGHIFHSARGLIIFGLGCAMRAPGGDIALEELIEELFPDRSEWEEADPTVSPVPTA